MAQGRGRTRHGRCDRCRRRRRRGDGRRLQRAHRARPRRRGGRRARRAGERLDPSAPDFAAVVDEITRDIRFPSARSRASAVSWQVEDNTSHDPVEISSGAVRLWTAGHALCAWTNVWAVALRSGDATTAQDAADVILGARTWPSITDTDPEMANESEFDWLPDLERAVRAGDPAAARRPLAGNSACMPGLAPALGLGEAVVRPSASRADVEELYRRHAGEIRGYLHRRAGQAGADLLGEVFVVALRRVDELPAPELRRAWLFATARRLLLAAQRKERQRHDAEHEHARTHEPRLDAPGGSHVARAQAVRDALTSLADRDRELIRLTEWEGLTIAEAALVLRLRPGTARVRLHRARRALAAHPALARLLEPSPDSDPEGSVRTLAP